jgi:predicted phage terminase large subunit-like protein
VAYLTRGLAGFRVVSGVESGAKAVRAMPVASQANAGNLSVLRGVWNRAFLEELQDFPGGAKDDQVDALSRAFGMLSEASVPARRVRVGFSDR